MRNCSCILKVPSGRITWSFEPYGLPKTRFHRRCQIYAAQVDAMTCDELRHKLERESGFAGLVSHYTETKNR